MFDIGFEFSPTFMTKDDKKIDELIISSCAIYDTANVFDMALEGNNELMEALAKSIENRRQTIVEHPVVGKLIERAAMNMGITVDEYMDRVFADDGTDPNEQLELLGALLEANEELTETEE